MQRLADRAHACIFCLRQGAVSKSVVAHVTSESLFGSAPKLPPGAECDSCNNILSNVERKFLNDSLISVFRVIEGGRTKKHKLPSTHWKGSSIVAVESPDGRRTIQIRVAGPPSDMTDSGFTLPLPPEAPVVVSRFLCKTLVEALRLCDSPYAYDPRLDPVRKYAIDPRGGRFVPYAFRSAESGSDGLYTVRDECAPGDLGPCTVLLRAFRLDFLMSGLPLPEAPAFFTEAARDGWHVRSSVRAPKQQRFRFGFILRSNTA